MMSDKTKKQAQLHDDLVYSCTKSSPKLNSVPCTKLTLCSYHHHCNLKLTHLLFVIHDMNQQHTKTLHVDVDAHVTANDGTTVAFQNSLHH